MSCFYVEEDGPYLEIHKCEHCLGEEDPYVTLLDNGSKIYYNEWEVYETFSEARSRVLTILRNRRSTQQKMWEHFQNLKEEDL